MQRRALIAIAFLPALVAASQDTPKRYFGHEVQLLSGNDGETRLVVDGRELVRHEIIGIDEAAIVGGVGVVIGYSGSGGNACDQPPFVLSFPGNKAPRFDGPLDTCSEVIHVIGKDEIQFEVKALPGRDGERWLWTPQSGFQSAGSIKHVPSPEKTWSVLRSRKVDHPYPWELFDYAEIASQIHALLGPEEQEFLPIITGVGSGDFQGDMYVGTSCTPHMCDDTGALIVADLERERVFLAWKTENRPIIVRPPIKEWSHSGRVALRDWSKTWTAKR
jgi:hypothetical protein